MQYVVIFKRKALSPTSRMNICTYVEALEYPTTTHTYVATRAETFHIFNFPDAENARAFVIVRKHSTASVTTC